MAAELTRKITSKLLDSNAPPNSSVSIRVPKNTLRSVVANGLRKQTTLERMLPLNTRRWVNVEAAEGGTSDSIFFVPEHPSVDHSHERVHPAQYVKVNAQDCADVVRRGDDFELSFCGMSVAPMDVIGNNELLLCSLTRDDGILDKSEEQSATLEDADVDTMADLAELPTSLTVQPGDTPFLHYDPIVDGHDTGSAPDSFVPIPGSKRVYLQRRGETERDVFVRFTVMEVDKLSEEQLIAIKSLEEIGKSVGKAAATVPYLKFISWILKFANFLGRSALKKVSQPEHVLSKDIAFLLAEGEEESESTSCGRSSARREEYGNYLRYGYYFFLSSNVDAKLYAQTGASSQSVPLLMRRYGYNANSAFRNEREFFPLTGVSYVVLKVTRGYSPLDKEQRRDMLARHRIRVVNLLKKYTGTLGDAVQEDKKEEKEKEEKQSVKEKREVRLKDEEKEIVVETREEPKVNSEKENVENKIKKVELEKKETNAETKEDTAEKQSFLDKTQKKLMDNVDTGALIDRAQKKWIDNVQSAGLADKVQETLMSKVQQSVF